MRVIRVTVKQDQGVGRGPSLGKGRLHLAVSEDRISITYILQTRKLRHED